MKTNQVQKTGTQKLIAVLWAATLVMLFQSSFATAHEPSKSGEETRKRSASERIRIDCKNTESMIILASSASFPNSRGIKNRFNIVSDELNQEKDLKIESWMISSRYFEKSSTHPESGSDKKLTLESWMTSQKIWND